MKIINAMFSKVNGGLEQVFLNYTKALTLQGNHVIPVIHPRAEIKNSCPQNHLKTIHNFNQYDYLAIYRLRQLIQKEQPDCVITHSYRAAYLLNKTKTNVPKIAVCHVRGHYNFGTDAIIAITDQMRQDIINSGIAADRVFTVPNMVHIPEELTFKEPAQFKVPIIGVCARLAKIKGVDVFINALAELKKRNIAFKAQIAGDGSEKEHCIALIQDLDLNENVQLLGWIEDRHSFYKNLDIFCLPSREEAFGLVVLEAMMHSLPMVLSQLSGPVEIVGDTQSALLVQPEDPISMADALEQIITDQQLAKKLAFNAFQRVQHYSSINTAPVLHRVLETVCQNYRFIKN
ncbi:glycosyltransferase family 4 protein [Legionella worsleiensis]|uniref:CapM protein, capsular polysaccharide biosynthesis n=1 Tax=Legionella worsleiensis TaxID=45076 RepID=A0A0W1AEK1_9GAMM|nr:glycosyltransferase family 4 protein [Legionella worsleiensis]KTD79765.1 CapM protein, capsular polysaccharide biosynthesis [Legionella worsleiensis]STY32276.1 CapM protein, capsular polysaccharide biosynthesis [Legionella worsleiensis]